MCTKGSEHACDARHTEYSAMSGSFSQTVLLTKDTYTGNKPTSADISSNDCTMPMPSKIGREPKPSLSEAKSSCRPPARTPEHAVAAEHVYRMV